MAGATAVIDWLMCEGRHAPDMPDVVEGFCRQLVDAGVPLRRHTVGLTLLHPQLRFMAMIWRCDKPGVEVVRREHGVERSVTYTASPLHRVIDGGVDDLRFRLDRLEPPWDHPILGELKEEGVTDYAVMALRFANGQRGSVTFATTREGGFRESDLILVDHVLPVLTMVLETMSIKKLTRTVLETYVGRRTSARILEGGIRRDGGAELRAVLWYCDLRGFTPLADRLPRLGLISLLNGYFDIMGGAVEKQGAEILKFIGDAMLAIFPLGGDEDGSLDEPTACCRALAAARDALAGIDARNRERSAWGEPTLRCGIALHMGDVMYGNIGSPRRLDFTVIGPAVNLVNRIEGLCKTLDRTVLTSAAFARHCPEHLETLGRHEVKGVKDQVEVFGLRA